MSTGLERRTDLGTLIGLPLAAAVVVGAQFLEGGALGTLAQPTAALVVFGGTLAALLISFPAARLGRAVRAVGRVLMDSDAPATELVARMGDYANRVRRNKGVFVLEAELSQPLEPFLHRAVELAVDGFRPSEVRRLLESESRTLDQEEHDNAELFESAAGYAPTLGILGAVLGLIHVMENLAAPSELGRGIAVAFVATVYGVGSANLVFLPLATKIRAKAHAAALRREMIIEGIAAIQDNQHPRLMDRQLTALMHQESQPVMAARA